MILIISHEQDEHARVVRAELDELGADHHLLDLAEFPQRIALTLRYEDGRPLTTELRHADGRRVDLRQLRSVWWRRPQPIQVHSEIARPTHSAFALNECMEAVAGLWLTLDAFWINDPTRDQVAARKAHQLEVARNVGLAIPETLISNDPEEVRSFLAAMGERPLIYKSFSATPQEWRETRRLGADELAVLDQVRHAPVIFQEYVEAEVDLRVTVIGREIYAAAIHSQATTYPADFRIDMGRAELEATALPAEVEGRLLELMEALGLVYGAIDVRRTPEGRHVFLEINPAGQWLFVEQRSGQPITSALARALAAGGEAKSGRR